MLHVVHRAERAGDGADLAADAEVVEDDVRAGGYVDLDGLYRAGVQAPRFVALGARVGHPAPSVVEVENLDARFRRVEDLIVLVRAGHLALQAPGALRRVDVKRLLHVPSPDRALERAHALLSICTTMRTLNTMRPGSGRGKPARAKDAHASGLFSVPSVVFPILRVLSRAQVSRHRSEFALRLPGIEDASGPAEQRGEPAVGGLHAIT